MCVCVCERERERVRACMHLLTVLSIFVSQVWPRGIAAAGRFWKYSPDLDLNGLQEKVNHQNKVKSVYTYMCICTCTPAITLLLCFVLIAAGSDGNVFSLVQVV